MADSAITITTINVPRFLEGLCKNIYEHNHKDETCIIIIGDKKTPSEAEGYCIETAGQFGIELDYLSVEKQAKEFKKYPELLDLFPFNTPDRVILGGMLSYIRGFDRLIAVDDDNFSTEHDFVGYHSITGKETEISLIENELGWFNVYNALIEENNVPFYPRGYPWKQRTDGANQRKNVQKTAKVIVNQGLVLEDPDIDAISWLFWPIRAIGMREEFGPQFGLIPGVWSPFNYQNTALYRDLIPCYFRPLSALRNADIWTAYVFNKIGEHFSDVITFGQPLVKQLRNPHNLWDDLDVELINNRATDYLITILRGITLTEKSYFEALVELLGKCQKEIEETKDIPGPEYQMIKMFFVEYQEWCRIVSEIVR